jgi:hypothetical protein
MKTPEVGSMQETILPGPRPRYGSRAQRGDRLRHMAALATSATWSTRIKAWGFNLMIIEKNKTNRQVK